MLCEMKKMSLSDKLGKFYPDYPSGDSITMEHLITHTSGIQDYTQNIGFMRNESSQEATEEQMLALFEDKPLNFRPGLKNSYSNSGYLLLGYIIQKVTGMSYENAMRKYIFIPLKMHSSGFDFTHLISPDKAVGYSTFLANDKKVVQPIDSSVILSAGAIYSTVGDLFKWHQALQKNKLLSREITAKSYTPYKGSYGFGWEIDTLAHPIMVSHTGSVFGFRSKITRIPASDICIILLNNHEDDPFLNEITDKILAILQNKSYELPLQPKHLENNDLISYVGNYAFDPEQKNIMEIILTVDKHLMMKIKGVTKLELYQVTKDKFIGREKETETANFDFMKDRNGTITGLMVTRSGLKTLIGRRVDLQKQVLP